MKDGEISGDCNAKRSIHVANRCPDKLPRASAARHSRHERRYAASRTGGRPPQARAGAAVAAGPPQTADQLTDGRRIRVGPSVEPGATRPPTQQLPRRVGRCFQQGRRFGKAAFSPARRRWPAAISTAPEVQKLIVVAGKEIEASIQRPLPSSHRVAREHLALNP